MYGWILAKVGTYTLEGRFVEDKGRIVLAESFLLDREGQEVARATGKLFKARS